MCVCVCVCVRLLACVFAYECGGSFMCVRAHARACVRVCLWVSVRECVGRMCMYVCMLGH